MCKASILANKTIDATHGQHLEIGVSTYGIAAFHNKGTPVVECVTCVKDGQSLTLWGIPLELQKLHGIDAMERVTFVDSGDNEQDYIRCENGKEIPLVDFANQRITAYVGELERPESAVEDGAGFGDRAKLDNLVTA